MTSFRTIVCAVDLSDFTARVAAYAVSFASRFGAKLIVVYATPPLTQYTAFETRPNSFEELAAEMAEAVRADMEKAVREHFAGVPVTPLVLPGFPDEVILKTADSSGADLIIMGTRGLRGVQRIVFGSVAEKVVKSAPVPVLTVRPESGEEGV